MTSQPQQPQDNKPNPSAVDSAALEPASTSELPSATRSIQKGRWIVTQVLDFLAQLFNEAGNFFQTYKQLIVNLALILGAIITLRVVLAIMAALNDIPLVAPTFKLVGVGYSVWFVSRYLLKTSTRQELWQQVQRFLHQQEISS